MRGIERRIRKIEKQTTRGLAFDSIIISREPSVQCKLYDMHQCPDYLKALQESPDRYVIYKPSCGDCTESDRGTS